MADELDTQTIDEILATANSLQAYDRQRGKVLESSTALQVYEQRVLEEMAQAHNIDLRYTQIALEQHLPSVQRQIELIRKLKATPSSNAIIDSYGEPILRSLRRALPTEELRIYRGSNTVYWHLYKEVEKSILFWKIRV